MTVGVTHIVVVQIKEINIDKIIEIKKNVFNFFFKDLIDNLVGYEMFDNRQIHIVRISAHKQQFYAICIYPCQPAGQDCTIVEQAVFKKCG